MQCTSVTTAARPTLLSRAARPHPAAARSLGCRCLAQPRQQQQQQQQPRQYLPPQQQQQPSAALQQATAALALALLAAPPAGAEEADVPAAAAIGGLTSAGWALACSPIVFYVTFSLFRTYVNPKAKFSDAIFILAALVLAGNILSILVFKVRFF